MICQYIYFGSSPGGPEGFQCTGRYLDDLQGLVNGGLRVEREAGVDLGRDLAGDYLKDIAAELDEESVEGILNLVVEIASLLLGEVDSGIYQLAIFGLLGGGEDERRVCGGILRLVLSDAWAFTGK